MNIFRYALFIAISYWTLGIADVTDDYYYRPCPVLLVHGFNTIISINKFDTPSYATGSFAP